jgi:hypothetical protein
MDFFLLAIAIGTDKFVDLFSLPCPGHAAHGFDFASPCQSEGRKIKPCA